MQVYAYVVQAGLQWVDTWMEKELMTTVIDKEEQTDRQTYYRYNSNWCGLTLKSLPDTPDSTKSDLTQLLRNEAEKEVEDEKQKERGCGTMATFNFINSIIGPGVIGKSIGPLMETEDFLDSQNFIT